MNHIHEHPSWIKGWRPDYYVNTDRSKNDQWKEDASYHLEESEKHGYNIILRTDMLDTTDLLDGIQDLKRNIEDYTHLRTVGRCNHVNSSFHPAKKWHPQTAGHEICTFGSPMFVAAQIAVLECECDELVLLGCDLGYTANLDENNYHKGLASINKRAAMVRWARRRNETLLMGHLILEKESKARGFRVFNATKGGMLEIHTRVPLEDLL